ncbi:hypothetical protein [Mycobacteroides abscessus]|uniref:hypothetical protein n=1 Tax=Mycobacteroides abscessus TaxID=36809 RepID=UPI000C26B8BD|nr:hypothetical protein [Mycobacteroides abscessus]
MIVDTANPEVSEALARWIRARDELRNVKAAKETADGDELSDLDEKEFDWLDDLKDVGDALVAFLAPTASDYQHHLALNPDPHADNPAA